MGAKSIDPRPKQSATYLGTQLGVDLSTSHVENSFIGGGFVEIVVVPVAVVDGPGIEGTTALPTAGPEAAAAEAAVAAAADFPSTAVFGPTPCSIIALCLWTKAEIIGRKRHFPTKNQLIN